MAGENKNITRPFSSKGLLLKSDPALLPQDTYTELTNLVSNIEGELTVRPGSQQLSASGSFPSVTGSIHSLVRLRTNATQSTRYVGLGTYIFASQSALPAAGSNMAFVVVGSACAVGGQPYPNQRFGSDAYSIGAAGQAYQFFGCPTAMLKGDGSLNTLLVWGLVAPLDPATAFSTTTGTGPVPFVGAETPYLYVYTNYSSATRSESNPCAFMIVPGAVPNGHPIQVRIAGSGDPQVNLLNVYRSGGSFADGLYRQIGQIGNPGGSGAAIFIDSRQDQVIINNQLLSTDNDPPVPSTLPSPLYRPVVSFNGGAQTIPGVFTLALGPGQGDALQVKLGSRVDVADISTGKRETAIARGSPSSNSINLFLQLLYPQGGNTFVYCDTSAGSPASIVLSAFDALFVAGDPNNPHVLYKSKNGSPEAFPVLEQDTGLVGAINVGYPSNPIMALIEYQGGVVCMCLESIFYVGVFQGAMGTPNKTPARHGLIAKMAYCKVANQVWYLSYDGIYSYAGGEEVLLTEEIDPLFHGLPSGNYLPVDLRQGLGTTGADVVTMRSNGVEVFVGYNDTAGAPHRLRYHTVFKRWSIDNVPFLITAQALEPDTGKLLFSHQANDAQSHLLLAEVGTSDGWVNTPNDGLAIPIAVTPATVNAPPESDRLYSDLAIEASNPSEALAISTFYNFSPIADPVDAFTVPLGSNRLRWPFPLNHSLGVQAYAFSLRITGTSLTGTISLYSLTLNYIELAQYRKGLAFDWDDLGYVGDKVLRNLNIEIDTGNIPATIQIQGDGINLGAPLVVNTNSLNRTIIVALADALIARQVRLVIVPGAGGWTKYYRHTFDKWDWPSSLNYWESDWTDMGHPFDKCLRNLELEIDTEGAQATATVWGDGAALQAFQLTTNSANRNLVFALSDNIVARLVRLVVTTAAATSRVRVFKWNIDKWDWPVTVPFWESPWTDLGYNHDKNLRNLNIDVDAQGQLAHVALYGDDALIGSYSFTTTINNRNRVFPLPDETIARMVRIIVTSDTPVPCRVFQWSIDKWDYPPQLTFWESEWDDLGWPFEKIFRNLNIDLDTGGLPVIVTMQGDGVTVATWIATTTLVDRNRVLTVPDNIVCKMVRLIVSAPTTAPTTLARVFTFKFDKQDEPAAITFWDSYEVNFGYDGFSWIKQAWLKYMSSQPIIVVFYVDNNVPFYRLTLPAHPSPSRDMERFYLPAVNAVGVLNKSKAHRFTISSGGTMKLYSAASKIEWLPTGTDQREGYQQLAMDQILQPST